MEDFFLLLLSAVADLLFEVFFQVVAEEVVALMVRFIPNAFQETRPIDPLRAPIGYLLLGSAFGIVSLLLFPHHFSNRQKFTASAL